LQVLRHITTIGTAANSPYTARMFDALLRRLLAPAPTLPATEADLALGALLVRLARSDGDYAPVEIARIEGVLALRHGLDPIQAKNLRIEAEALEAEAPDTVRFTRALKDAVPVDDRAELMQAIWSVALADGVRDAHEDQLMRIVANLLGLTDRDSALARQKAAKL
jgi:uncharacterized tellurite resistance protein B-like protein